MAVLIRFVLLLFCIFEVYTETDTDFFYQLYFPFINNLINISESENFKYNYNINHSIQFDVERVRRLNIYKQNHRLIHYDDKEDPEADFPEEYEENHHLIVLDFIGTVESYSGYTAEEHITRTDDDYNLILHRISGSPKSPKREGKNVVFIQHGLFLSSDAYVQNGPEKDIAFHLANLGYDVWFGNARGNSYSRSNHYYDINSTEFWDFSFHEIALNDLKSSIDFVLSETNSETLNFIGYSIGATEIYVLLSENPDYNKKINLLIAIDPMVFWKRTPYNKSHRKDLANIYYILKKIEIARGTSEIYPQSSFIQFDTFRKYISDRFFCRHLFSSFFGVLDEVLDNRVCKNISKYVPAGTSVKTLLHVLQLIETGEFQTFKSPTSDNLPVKYNLSKITINHAVFGSGVKDFVYRNDLEKLMDNLPNVVLYELLETDHNGFIKKKNDLDFPWSTASRDLRNLVADLITRISPVKP